VSPPYVCRLNVFLAKDVELGLSTKHGGKQMILANGTAGYLNFQLVEISRAPLEKYTNFINQFCKI
jgi:hypothetical protein